MTAIRSTFLRAVIGLDAAVCGLLGAGLVGGIAGPLGLAPAFAQPLGLFLLGYAVLLVWLALKPELPRRAVWGLVAFNGLWAVESVVITAQGWVAANAVGAAVLYLQAAGALGVAAMQGTALRMSSQLSSRKAA